MKVQDVMTADVRTVGPETSLRDVAAILAEYRISGLPVVDSERRVLGVVSSSDILVKERAEPPAPERRGFLGRLRRGKNTEMQMKVEARTAGEAMTSPAITVSPGTMLFEAVGRMIDHGVRRLPVLEEDRLVGILASGDLVRAFARSDAEIEEEIRDDVIQKTFFLPIESVQVKVRDGEVTITGAVDNKTNAEVLPSFIRRVPGVISVDARLTAWDVDRKEEVQVAAHI